MQRYAPLAWIEVVGVDPHFYHLFAYRSRICTYLSSAMLDDIKTILEFLEILLIGHVCMLCQHVEALECFNQSQMGILLCLEVEGNRLDFP